MPLGVVDPLEAVEVDRHDAEVELGSRTARELAGEISLEGTPVRTPRERIAERRQLQLIGRRLGGDEHDAVDQPTEALAVGGDSDEVSKQEELLDDDSW